MDVTVRSQQTTKTTPMSLYKLYVGLYQQLCLLPQYAVVLKPYMSQLSSVRCCKSDAVLDLAQSLGTRMPQSPPIVNE